MDRQAAFHRRRFSFFSISAFSLQIILILFSSFAAALDVSPQQMAAFQALSPAQQLELARQYGIDISAIQRSVGSTSSTPKAKKPEVSVLQRDGSLNPHEQLKQELEIGLLQQSLEEEEDKGPRYQAGKLVPFGYELFAGAPTTFEPIHDIPVSSDYILGPGDVIKVHLYGKESQEHELSIDAEGSVYFPELGPMELAGLSFEEAKIKLRETVNQRMIGMKASVSMGELRSIRVFVLGEAYVPGSYVVSSLSTITNALVLSGGIAETGSLRNIQLKRRGEVVQTLDLYKLLLEGDNSNDVSLRSGDVVFIPPVGATMGVDGEVRRPAIYELKEGESVADLIRFSGGMKPSAYPAAASMERIGADQIRTVVDVDLSQGLSRLKVGNGDILTIPSILDKVEQTVTVKGHVYRPGVRHWKPGLRVTDVIRSLDDLKPGSDLRYALIKRYTEPQGKLEVLSLRLDQALANPASEHNKRLKDNDELYVFTLYPVGSIDESELVADYPDNFPPGYLGSGTSAGSLGAGGARSSLQLSMPGAASVADSNKPKALLQDRGFYTEPVSGAIGADEIADRSLIIARIIEELRIQSGIGQPSKEVEITGPVRFPGVYPLVEGMTAEDLIYAAGGLTEKAFELSAEVNRTEFSDKRARQQQRFELNLANSKDLTFTFQSRDVLQIRVIPEWAEKAFVTLSGEVKFPGRYPIHKDDTLRDVLKRAGGVTRYAYVPGAVFTRVELQKQQQARLEEMQRRLAEDIAKAQLIGEETGKSSGDLGTAQKLLSQLQKTPALGRLVIDLEKVVTLDPDYKIILQDGDELIVPPKRNSVTIIGEVQLPISQVFEPGLDYWDYIDRSGGTTNKADEGRIYVIKANGGVTSPENSNWFANRRSQINPGDTIVVPLNADKLDQLVLWRDVSQIFYQIALGAAAVGSL